MVKSWDAQHQRNYDWAVAGRSSDNAVWLMGLEDEAGEDEEGEVQIEGDGGGDEDGEGEDVGGVVGTTEAAFCGRPRPRVLPGRVPIRP